MKGFVIGFPKSGTTTIHHALIESGLSSVHWKTEHGYCGEYIYRAFAGGRPPLADLAHYDVITQADVCLPKEGKNYWPNLDFSVLCTIREYYPECKFILNYRDNVATARSIAKWYDLQARIVASSIPGSPVGVGRTVDELARWIDAHHRAVRRFFRDDPRFVEIDIASEDAPDILGHALGCDIRWWGKANATTKPRRRRGPLRRVAASVLGR